MIYLGIDPGKEIWKDVVGYEGLYKVSSAGCFHILPRSWKTGANGALVSHNGKLTFGTPDNNGYMKVSLTKDSKTKYVRVHQLVAESFLGFKYDKKKDLVIDHIDRDPSNNTLNNLQIITHRQNLTKDKTGVPNIAQVPTTGKYVLYVGRGGKSIFVGGFENVGEAVVARGKALECIEKGENLSDLIATYKKKVTSKYKYVSWTKRNKKWAANVDTKGFSKWGGYFNTEEEAKEKVDEILKFKNEARK